MDYISDILFGAVIGTIGIVTLLLIKIRKDVK